MVHSLTRLPSISVDYVRDTHAEEDKIKNLDRFKDDALSDSQFERCFLYDSPYLKKVNDEPDPVERVTVQIFAKMHSWADRENRSEVQEAMAPLESSLSLPPKAGVSHREIEVSHRVHPFRKGINIYKQENPDQTIHTGHVIHNIWTTLAHVFLGWEFYAPNQDSRTTEQMMLDLKTSAISWFGQVDRDKSGNLIFPLYSTGPNKGLKDYYSKYFNYKMGDAFCQADKLLKHRQIYAQDASYQRLAFYTSLALSLIGKFLSQRVFTVLGLTTSSITFIFMLTHYGTSSIKLAKLASDLKDSVEIAEKEACSHRLQIDTIPTKSHRMS